MVTLADRYKAGDRDAVWADIRGGRASPEDSSAVLDLVMGGVADAVDLIVHRLDGAGWCWAYPEMRRTLPNDDDVAAVVAIEQRLGPLPLALRSCLLQVGEVWLCGTLPGWPSPTYTFDDLAGYPVMADPLVLPSARYMLQELTDWDSDEWVQSKRPWRFAFAPDELHKANISGGTHDLLLPNLSVDPMLEGVENRPGVTLLDYLRSALGFGGFPGFEFTSEVPSLIVGLAAELPTV